MLAVQTKARLWLSNAQEKQALYANMKRGDGEFQEGDFVMLNSDFVYDPIHTARQSRKLAQKALGPFKIEKKISRVAYKLFIPKDDNIKKKTPSNSHCKLEKIRTHTREILKQNLI